MENKIKALGLLSLIAIAAVIGGILMTARRTRQFYNYTYTYSYKLNCY